MNVAQALGFLFAGLVVGVLLGGMATFFFRRFMFDRQMRIAEKKASRMLVDAKYEAKTMVDGARQDAEKQKLVNTAEHRERKAELQWDEQKVAQKQETLDRKLEGVEQREKNLSGKEKEIDEIRAGVDELQVKQVKQLELISGMSSEEAKAQLLDAIQVELRDETTRRLKDWENELRGEADSRAQEILVQSIQRYASEVVSENTVTMCRCRATK